MANTNGWDAFIPNILNKWSKVTGNFSVNQVCAHGAIYGLDGTLWAASKDWPGLHEYEHPLEQDDGSTVNIKVNEFVCALAVSNGKRMPTTAGVRMGHTKFMMVRHDPEESVCYLSRMGGGGACVAKTKQALVIGIWDKNIVMSNGQPQTAGDCNDLTERVAKFMKEQNF